MDASKPNRRKSAAKKLEPIDWHEFANDAVLHGNMSTLYQRPPNEDPTAYASSEALAEIEKRASRQGEPSVPTVGMVPAVAPNFEAPLKPTEGLGPTAGTIPAVVPELSTGPETEATTVILPAVGMAPTGGIEPAEGKAPTVGFEPTPGTTPAAGVKPTVGLSVNKKIRPIRDLSDALTLAGQVLYRAMYGALSDTGTTRCTKGYRQLAAETHLDKDTVRDLIAEFKDKGLAREVGRYDPDTRSSKTYEVLSNAAVLELWREAGIAFVTTGRQRPAFCTAQGQALTLKPTVGNQPAGGSKPTVGE